MIRLIVGLFKFTVLAIVVLIVGQIPVEKKRIFDHVREFTSSPAVQEPIHWITQKVDFTNGYTGVYRAEKQKSRSGFSHLQDKKVPHPADQFEHSGSEHDELSAVLKKLKR